MSDVGGNPSVNNLTVVFDDEAASGLPDAATFGSGIYKPTNVGLTDAFAGPAPAGPYGTALSAFNGLNPNGTWALYVVDDLNSNSGSIANGWRLQFITQAPPQCCAPAGPPTLSIADASVAEGNNGTAQTIFAVTLSRPTVQLVTAQFGTEDGTAVAAMDYVPASGNISFAPGETRQTLGVAVLGDEILESNETFTVTLSGAMNAILARSAGTATIQDDEIRIVAGIVPDGVQLSFITLSGRSYRIERTGQLATTNVWHPVPGAAFVPGTGGVVQVLDTNAPSIQPQRFYRVRWLEP
jgi:hypothetical protein